MKSLIKLALVVFFVCWLLETVMPNNNNPTILQVWVASMVVIVVGLVVVFTTGGKIDNSNYAVTTDNRQPIYNQQRQLPQPNSNRYISVDTLKVVLDHVERINNSHNQTVLDMHNQTLKTFERLSQHQTEVVKGLLEKGFVAKRFDIDNNLMLPQGLTRQNPYYLENKHSGSIIPVSQVNGLNHDMLKAMYEIQEIKELD